MTSHIRRCLPWAAPAAAIAVLAAGVSLAAQGGGAHHQRPATHASIHGQEHHPPGAPAEHGRDHQRGCDVEQLAAHLHSEHASLAGHLAGLHEALRARHAADGPPAAHVELLHEVLRRHHQAGHAAAHDAGAEHGADHRSASAHGAEEHKTREHHHPCHGPEHHDRAAGAGATGAAAPAGRR